MRKFYFTMYQEKEDKYLPFKDGYVVVWAASCKEACELFMAKYPPTNHTCTLESAHNILRCVHIYEEGGEVGPLHGEQQDVIGWPD